MENMDKENDLKFLSNSDLELSELIIEFKTYDIYDPVLKIFKNANGNFITAYNFKKSDYFPEEDIENGLFKINNYYFSNNLEEALNKTNEILKKSNDFYESKIYLTLLPYWMYKEPFKISENYISTLKTLILELENQFDFELNLKDYEKKVVQKWLKLLS